jgi:hypothetical protein
MELELIFSDVSPRALPLRYHFTLTVFPWPPEILIQQYTLSDDPEKEIPSPTTSILSIFEPNLSDSTFIPFAVTPETEPEVADELVLLADETVVAEDVVVPVDPVVLFTAADETVDFAVVLVFETALVSPNLEFGRVIPNTLDRS